MSGGARVLDVAVEAAPPAPLGVWRTEVLDAVKAGIRPVTLFGRALRPGDEGGPCLLTAVLQDPGGALSAYRTVVEAREPYPALTAVHPAFQGFERELHEQLGLPVTGHPWLKPVRFEGRFEGRQGQVSMNDYPYYRIEGKDVHEVAVGPIHAGVIEPGSFRFMCHGERVLHLEIQLGYQHRGVEEMLRGADLRRAAPLVETIAGDSSVANAWAYAAMLEALVGVEVADTTDRSRGLLLELERIAMHLATLSGLAADIGFLQGATTYGRLRTTAINTTMRLVGGRFGRGGVRPGGAAFSLTAESRATVLSAVSLLEADLASIDDRWLSDTSVRRRLVHVGTVKPALAAELGLVGLVGRASGLRIDQREGAGGVYGGCPVEVQVEPGGDCWARSRIRVSEIGASLRWIRALLQDAEPRTNWTKQRVELPRPRPGRLVVGLVEGWRGEVVHVVETGPAGETLTYKVQDPSFRNWLGLAMAVRGNEIADFPICNKSFDLSYCGHDL